jgi:GNAT superfamily N-acetyltransferase
MIRRARPGDELALAGLNGFVQELHAAARPDIYRRPRAEEVAAWFAALLRKPSTAVWIAEADDKPIGYIVGMIHEQSENTFCFARRWCEIDQIGVHPQWQKQGVGKALFDVVLESAARHGISEIELNTWWFNESAQAAFQQWGFSPKTIRMSRTIPLAAL